jgi:hypothetical protein
MILISMQDQSAPASTYVCPCGQCGAGRQAHIVANRKTADGVFVYIYSDGGVTGVMGSSIGIPLPRPRTIGAVEARRRAARYFAEWVSVYDYAELPGLWEEALAKTQGRAIKAKSWRAPITWTVERTDRDGRPTLRVGTLPRLLLDGIVIWHELGRYDVYYVRGDYKGRYLCPSGFRFRTRRDLDAWIKEQVSA